MPQVVQPDSLATILASIERRLEALERSGGLFASLVCQDQQSPPVTRVGVGQLDALFPSAGYASGTYGLRVQDASGAPVLDSLGLMAVMKLASGAGAPGQLAWNMPLSTALQLGTPVYPAYAVQTNGTSNFAITNTSFAFRLPRTGLSALLLYNFVGVSEKGAAAYQIGPVLKVQIDGVGQYDYTPFAAMSGSGQYTFTYAPAVVVGGLSGGTTYTARLVFDAPSGWYVTPAAVTAYAFVLGS
jgi:hypothetical protein